MEEIRIKSDIRECYLLEEDKDYLEDLVNFLPKEDYVHLLNAYAITEIELKHIVNELLRGE